MGGDRTFRGTGGGGRFLGRWTGWILGVGLLGLAATASAVSPAFRLSDQESEVYYHQALAAGEEIQLAGGVEVTGDIVSNGRIHLERDSRIDGAAAAAGKVDGQGTITGEVTEGSDPVALPVLLSEADLRALADQTFDGDQTFDDLTLDGVVFVDGQVRIRGDLGGEGTLIATRDIRLDGADGEPGDGSPHGPFTLDPDSRISLISLEDIRLGKGRPFRGVLRAARDAQLDKDISFEGVIVADRKIQVDKDSTLTFVDFDPVAPEVHLVSPADGAFLSTPAPEISVRYTDDFSGLREGSLELLLDGADRTAEASRSGASPDITLSLTPSEPLADGTHTVEGAATDHSDNEGRESFSFVVDTVPPTVEVTSPADLVVFNTPPSLEVDYADATSGVDPATVGIALDGTDITASCSVSETSATCPSPADLAEGDHTIDAQVADRAGNGAAASLTFRFIIDHDPPAITVETPADGATVSDETITVSGTATDKTEVASLTVDGEPVDVVGDAFSTTVSLAPGPNTITIAATDIVGNSGSVTITVTRLSDITPPNLAITSPAAGIFLSERRPAIDVSFSDDDSGVDPASLAFTANGAPLAVSCNAGALGARCTPTVDLPETEVQLAASLDDFAGNRATAEVAFTVDTVGLEVFLNAPDDGFITRNGEVEVRGEVQPQASSVEINGVHASLSGTTFTATVPLREGVNMLVALATKANGRTSTATIEVTRDIVPPIVRINSPSDGFVSIADSIVVTGVVNDSVTGGVETHVRVNGIEVPVADGAFVLTDLPLVPGPNTIEAVATDAAGNSGTHAITVRFEQPVGPRIRISAGNGQRGLVRETLPEPLVAKVTDDLGNPVAGRIVTFEVTRNSGTLRAKATDIPARHVQVVTDGAGLASVLYTLGESAGEGNNRVHASGLGVAGDAEFCASARSGDADHIVATAGGNQRALVGRPLPTPFEALVLDKDGNPVAGVPVTFRVVQGSGQLDGQSALTRTTDIGGSVRAVLTLGLDPGISNNVVSARFDGLVGLPATFTASGLAPGPPAATRFSGIVLDNGLTAIPGAEVSIVDTSLSTTTDEQGRFTISGVPVGHIKLHVDPSGSPRPESFPPLEFEAVTVAGQDNTLGMPVLLPAVDTDNSKVVGGSEDVTVTMKGVDGLALTVFAHSVTFPDGSHVGRVSISQVQLDKVPMPPPNGTIFMAPTWTVQPHGVVFDPPARITIPNNGLAPGTVIDIFQFDHQLNQFVTVGKGTVSEDGRTVTSDPGFGIVRAGWGGGGPPPPPPTCTCGCSDGNDCTQDNCSGQPNCRCSHENLTNSQCCDGTKFDPGEQGCCGDQIYARRTQCCEQDKILTKHPIEDLDDCPNRVPFPGWQFQYDGCSLPFSPGFDKDNPAGGSDTQFSNPQLTGACDEHDRCYQTCHPGDLGAARLGCDQTLLNIAIATCNASHEPLKVRQSCLKWAQRYYNGLRLFGGSAFKGRQKEVCQCCP